LIAAAAFVTLAGAVVVERAARHRLKETLTVHPPFRVPSASQRRDALGRTDGLPLALLAALTDSAAFEPIPAPHPADWLASQTEPGQTFDQFVASQPNRPDTARSILYLQPLGDFRGRDAPSLELLSRFAAAFFGTPVMTLPARDVDGLGVTDRINRDTGAPQLLTGDLRRLLRERMPEDAFAVLGLTMEDLYPGPSWNFVFGEASLKERVGVYSFARYAPPALGGKSGAAPAKLILLRGSKVLAHETGHMFGLVHCIYYRCLMNGSNHIGELDARPLHLCPVCLRKLQWSVGFGVVERYRRLRDAAREAGFDDEARWLDERLRVLGAG
jgi:archaemetzincin